MKINFLRGLSTLAQSVVRVFTGDRRNAYIAGKDETVPVSSRFPTRFAQAVAKYHPDKKPRV